jgi:hypothetical protein
MRLITAAALYFLIVFSVGLVCGPVRVLWLEPQLGETAAVLCEAPLLLCAMVIAARWLPRTLGLKTNTVSLLGMGFGALFLQQLADFAVGIVLRGMTPGQLFAHFLMSAGLIYAALLVAFAAMPVLVNWPRRLRTDLLSRPNALCVIKAIHTLIWAFFAGCILAIPIFALRGWFGGVMVLTILVFIETAVLITHNWRCPLTNVAANYTDDRSDNFDIYLPNWLARRNKLTFGWLFAVGLAFSLVLWLKSTSFRT